jgi:adenine deaminase
MTDQMLTAMSEELRASKGLDPADLLIRNIRILDVFTETIFDGSLSIKNGKIVAVNIGPPKTANQEFDGQGLLAIPGFIDAHIHLETCLVTPEALAAAIVPHGTTTLFAEILDFARTSSPIASTLLLRRR